MGRYSIPLTMSLPNEEVFTNIGKPWNTDEDSRLISEYNSDRLNLMEICKIHGRMPSGVLSRLVRLNVIVIKQNARGYRECVQSDLYKNAKRKLNEVRKEKLKTIVSNTINSDISELKEDIKGLKKDVSKILELMNALYEFESSQQY